MLLVNRLNGDSLNSDRLQRWRSCQNKSTEKVMLKIVIHYFVASRPQKRHQLQCQHLCKNEDNLKYEHSLKNEDTPKYGDMYYYYRLQYITWNFFWLFTFKAIAQLTPNQKWYHLYKPEIETYLVNYCEIKT